MLTDSRLEVLETLSKQWGEHPYFRFYFIFSNHRYQLNIFEKLKSDKITSGIVTNKKKYGLHHYSGKFTTLEEAFDVEYLKYFYDKYIEQDIDAMELQYDDNAQKKFTESDIIDFLGFNPTTTIIIPEEFFLQAITIANATVLPITKGNRGLIVDTLTGNGFWGNIKNARIIGKKQSSLNRKTTLKPLYEALLSPTVLNYSEVLSKVESLPESELKVLCLTTLQTYNSGSNVVIDWKG